MKHRTSAAKKSATVFLGAVLLSISAFGATGTTPSRYVAFTRSTDTISSAGNTVFTNQATYEVIFSPTSTSGGGIWNTWQAGTQDDGIAENNLDAEAYTYPASPSFFIVGGLSVGNWYDVAYVYDGSQERTYINGVLAASRAASGSVGIGTSNTMNVGAIFRDGTIASSFLGDIVSLRISDTARYSGNS
jgi:hypothetical protein